METEAEVQVFHTDEELNTQGQIRRATASFSFHI